MGVVILDGPTVAKSVENSEKFDRLVNEHFDRLNQDGNTGGLSYDVLRKRDGKFSYERELQSEEEVEAMYKSLFERFDADNNGLIDREEFKKMMKEIMMVKANSIGDSPIMIILQEDSLLFRAIQH